MLACIQGGLPLVTAEAAAGCAGGGSCLRVTLVDAAGASETRIVTNAELRAAPYRDLGTTRYRTRYAPGQDPQDEPTFLGAVSVRSLLTNLGRNPDAVTSVEIRDPARNRTTGLAPEALAAAGSNGFESGLQPAFEATSTDTVNYARPLRAGDPQDTNNDDVLLTGTGDVLEVVVRSGGRRVTPTITGAPQAVRAGQAVTFASSVDPPGSYRYDWTFGDGSTSGDAGPVHTFATPGSYLVSLQVFGDAYGQSNVLRVDVTDASPPSSSPSPSPSPTRPTPRPGRPGSGGGGGTSQDPDAPDTGPRDGSDGQTGGASSGPTATPGPSVTPSASPSAPPTPRPTPGRPSRPQQTTPPTEPVTQQPDTVSGTLLSDTRTDPVGRETATALENLAATAPTAASARPGTAGGGARGRWWSAALVIALLALGALAEGAGSRRPRPGDATTRRPDDRTTT